MLKIVRHVENSIEISRCVENIYVRHVENHVENRVEVRKKHHHTLCCMMKLSGRFHFSSSILHTFLGLYILNYVLLLQLSQPLSKFLFSSYPMVFIVFSKKETRENNFCLSAEFLVYLISFYLYLKSTS